MSSYPFETRRIVISYTEEDGSKTVIDMHIKKDAKRSPFEIALDVLEEFRDVKSPMKVAIQLKGNKWHKFRGNINSIIEAIKKEVRE